MAEVITMFTPDGRVLRDIDMVPLVTRDGLDAFDALPGSMKRAVYERMQFMTVASEAGLLESGPITAANVASIARHIAEEPKRD